MNVYEQLAANFRRWEERGRGILVYPAPVSLEPPFIPFPGHRVDFGGPRDDGTKPTLLSRLTERAFRALQPPKEPVSAPLGVSEEQEPMPDWFGEEEELPIEFRVLLPAGASYPAEAMAHFLTTLSHAAGVMALEIIGTAGEVVVQITCRPGDADMVASQLQAQFPDARLTWSQDGLASKWEDSAGMERVVLDFGLSREFMSPLESPGRIDPFASLIGGMASLGEDETAIYQVIFTPLAAPWAENTMASVTKEDGRPFFDDGAELVKQASAKVSRPLYGVVLRLASKAAGLPGAWDIVRGMTPTLRLFARHGGQSLVPLDNTDYDHGAHCTDVLWRRSRRCGMILNLDEMVGLVHWPTASVKSPKLARIVESNSRPAPAVEVDTSGIGTVVLGINEHDGVESPVVLSRSNRLQHMHCIGASGTGKSTLLLSMILRDLESGQGFALLDPHGDLIDRVLSQVPESRLGDVVLIDPSDDEHVTPFNVLLAHSDYEKTLLASDLVSVFRRLSTSWGDRMGIIFQNLVLAFLEHREGGTLAGMRRFLVDADWREEFLEGVEDPDVVFYWEQTFPKLDGPKSVGPILTRLETLLTPKIIRHMVSQRHNLIDFGEIMDRGRILLVRLPQGQIGKENAFMLGSLVMVKLQQMAMGRARMAARERTPFFCYVDECQHFVTPGMSEILSGARKYGLGLVLAHQDLRQLSQNADVEAAVMTNAATRVVFRVSESDGRALKGDFAHYDAKDFSELPDLHAICRNGRADNDFNLRVIRPDDPDPLEAEKRRRAAIEASRSRYTVPRREVEEENRRRMAAEAEEPKARKGGGAKNESVSDRKLRTSEVPTQDGASECETHESDSQPIGLRKDSAAEPDSLLAVPKIPMSAPRPAGMGRGGDDHQLIVSQLALEGGRLGYKVTKEATVPDGRVDLTLESRARRIAVEVAVNSNTAHEIDNLAKCLSAGFDHVVSVSPLENMRSNISKAAAKAFPEDALAKLRFLSNVETLAWLAEFAEADSAASVPAPESTKIIAGRRVRVRQIEVTADERRKIEAEQIEVIADLVSKNQSNLPTASPNNE